MSLLHVCLRYNPPLEVVLKMIKMFSDRTAALRAQDAMGRTPLHIAAAYDADPTVLKLLGSADPMTCSILDKDGRSPLHLACDSSCNILHDENAIPTGPQEPQRQHRDVPSYDAVRALLSESLHPALIEDEDGMSALEYAIISDASIEVVNLLQKATMQLRQQEQQERQRLSKKRRLLDEASTDGNTDSSIHIQRRRTGILGV